MSLFNRTTPQQLRTLERCRAPEMAPLLELLTSTLAEAQAQLLVADAPVVVYRLQGKCAVLKGLLDAIRAAHAK